MQMDAMRRSSARSVALHTSQCGTMHFEVRAPEAAGLGVLFSRLRLSHETPPGHS
jgi:hypothetical protein